MSMNKLATVLLISILLIGAVGVTGCVEEEGPPETYTPTTLVIQFGDDGGSIGTGNTTTWNNVDGEWDVSSVDGGGETTYVFLNISADNCLGQLDYAADVAGFDIDKSYFSVPGGWLVEGIDGLETEVPGPAWQFWVNGEYSSYSADQIDLVEGDEVEWRYQLSAF
jgi:hypothetical protein